MVKLTITQAVLEEEMLIATLSDGRVILYPLTGMTWITAAGEEQKQNFEVTEWEIYWPGIDDGLTLEHLLSPRPRVDFTLTPPPNWERVQQLVQKHHKPNNL